MAFNRDRNSRPGFRSRPSFGDSPRFAGGADRPRFGDRGGRRGPTEMHKAICDKCGKECEVPFRPTQGKPVYCSNCFGDKQSLRSQSDLRMGGNGNRNEVQPQYNKQFEALNTKLDRILSLLSPIAPTEEITIENIEKPIKVATKKTKVKETTHIPAAEE